DGPANPPRRTPNRPYTLHVRSYPRHVGLYPLPRRVVRRPRRVVRRLRWPFHTRNRVSTTERHLLTARPRAARVSTPRRAAQITPGEALTTDGSPSDSMDHGRWTMDDGRWTMDDAPWTKYHPLNPPQHDIDLLPNLRLDRDGQRKARGEGSRSVSAGCSGAEGRQIESHVRRQQVRHRALDEQRPAANGAVPLVPDRRARALFRRRRIVGDRFLHDLLHGFVGEDEQRIGRRVRRRRISDGDDVRQLAL